jgi:putative membrane protein
MAWVRTSLSMIGFGFTIGKLGQVLRDVQFRGLFGVTRTVSMRELSLFLVILGTVALLAAAIQYRLEMRRLYGLGLTHKFSITFLVALSLVCVGAFALSALVLRL